MQGQILLDRLNNVIWNDLRFYRLQLQQLMHKNMIMKAKKMLKVDIERRLEDQSSYIFLIYAITKTY